jgi:hypothetical protein
MNFSPESVNHRFITYSDSQRQNIRMLKTWGKAMVLETFAANEKQYDIRL